MKKILISCWIIVLFASISVAQKAENFTDGSGKKQGLWEEKSPSGKSLGSFTDDQKDGCWTGYSNDGKLIRVENFKHGIRDGIAIDIDQRGYLVSEMYYFNNQLEGTAKKFFYGTNPASSIDYLHGKMNGKKRLYYENSAGKLMEESEYKDDLKNGPSNFFTISGDPIAEYTYVNNMLQGVQKAYYPGKKLLSEQEFKDNVENGIYKEYFQNGKLKSEGIFLNGLMNGTWKDYNEDGTLKAQGNMINGVKEGKWMEYDASGKVIKTEKYIKGELK